MRCNDWSANRRLASTILARLGYPRSTLGRIGRESIGLATSLPGDAEFGTVNVKTDRRGGLVGIGIRSDDRRAAP